eukprot:TRINITY_DN44488_c0_g1_i1.p1 TRINITY_DN44488_c0_g1~~TRINITY_DN44488_c0_g1_i1.p1  ORF type:complete len:321 (-),score=41.12 TRINITY_DN44488_c0_g1_i1:122-1084(-)
MAYSRRGDSTPRGAYLPPGYDAPFASAYGVPSLPFGWECITDPASGRLYYCNRQTGQSSWTPPPSLPRGWEAVLDRRTGATYYCNRSTGESSWTVPSGSSGRKDRSRSRSHGGRYHCKLFVYIENEPKFRVGQRIIGEKGANVKDIVARAGEDIKLRLRGHGSGFKESSGEEANEPLQLAVSAASSQSLDRARALAEQLLADVHRQYEDYCRKAGKAPQYNKKTAPYPCNFPPGKMKDAPPPRLADGDLPTPEEIEDLIEQRNQARLDKDYRRADQIRDELYERRVVLSDEKCVPGTRQGKDVTTWRYWRDRDDAGNDHG